ncbi:hypothetical protein NHQ30_011330 [Ciborinia camelliae]|nr:hypothetical protein NHQ30_011330 [Ciborinia camelliae]
MPINLQSSPTGTTGLLKKDNSRRGSLRRMPTNITDIGARVEKLREEADPSKKLHFTDLASQRRQTPNGCENLLEEYSADSELLQAKKAAKAKKAKKSKA